MELISKSVEETQKIARDLAKKITNSKPEQEAVVVAFEGELGAGKTTFIQALAKALGVKSNLTSPTFVLLKQYGLKLKSLNFKTLIHIDAYRIHDGKDLLVIGVDDMIKDRQNIILIEWAERVQSILPRNCIKIHIDHIDENKRRISIKGQVLGIKG
jgi:tRNA threonylcarbamoyladenosine biosynthesis protein TsaE